MSFGKQLLTTASETFIAELKSRFEEDAKLQKRETVIFFAEAKDPHLKQKFTRFDDILKIWCTENDITMKSLQDVDKKMIGYHFTW